MIKGTIINTGVLKNSASVIAVCVKEGVDYISNGITRGIGSITEKTITPFVAAAEQYLKNAKQSLLSGLFNWGTANLHISVERRRSQSPILVESALQAFGYFSRNLSVAANVSGIDDLVPYCNKAADAFLNPSLWKIAESTDGILVFFGGQLFSNQFEKVEFQCRNSTNEACGFSATVDLVVALAMKDIHFDKLII